MGNLAGQQKKRRVTMQSDGPDKAELLAMLTAHGIDPLKVHGGVPSITQMDVAGMMARCSPCEAALLRAKYCGEPPHEAWSYWFRHLMDQGWSEGDGRVERLSLVTLDEHLGHNRCPACNGTAGRMIGTKYQQCPRCGGTGIVYQTGREIARSLGFKSGLHSIWNERLTWCRGELLRWEGRAIAKMR